MMKQLCALALCLMMTGLGCATTVWWGSHSKTLRMGMSEKQVHALLGDPQDMTTRHVDDLMIETWRYLDRTLTFQNGLLQSWSITPNPSASPAAP